MQPHKRKTTAATDRLHHRLASFCVANSAIFYAGSYVRTGKVSFVPGSYGTMLCNQMELAVHVPIYGPILSALRGSAINSIEYEFVRWERARIYEAREAAKWPDNSATMLPIYTNMIAPIFVEYYEAHKNWIYKTCGHQNDWPELLRFARQIKNSISHNGVRIDRKEPPVSWAGLTYSGDDTGKRSPIGVDLIVGDILVLLFEMDDKLNELGCPLVTQEP